MYQGLREIERIYEKETVVFLMLFLVVIFWEKESDDYKISLRVYCIKLCNQIFTSFGWDRIGSNKTSK